LGTTLEGIQVLGSIHLETMKGNPLPILLASWAEGFRVLFYT
jgi:hypothetical protein